MIFTCFRYFFHEGLNLLVRYDTRPFCINFLENLIKHKEEFFVLHQLKVKDTLFEHLVLKWSEYSSLDFSATLFEFILDVNLITKIIHFFNNLLGHPLLDATFLDFL